MKKLQQCFCAAIACLFLLTGCQRMSVVGADGHRYVRVTEQRELGNGLSIRDEWQREDAMGKGKPTYFRLIQPKSVVAPPMFTRSGSTRQ